MCAPCEQVVMLCKVFPEDHPDEQCPRMSFRLGTRQEDGSALWTAWKPFGHETACRTHDLADYTVAVPWSLLFKGSGHEATVGSHAFQFDLYQFQRVINNYYQVK